MLTTEMGMGVQSKSSTKAYRSAPLSKLTN
jgi:hypothetical protein